MPHPRSGEGGILLLGHLDTVHPVGTLSALPFRRDGDARYGPGLMDMKGDRVDRFLGRAARSCAVVDACPDC
ncbi:hypothetical protein SAMN05444340_10332 [Citreimonas salinaria]|uniref:M20/M25/M40 family metallo-hydrolase n=2 Tax=Citreimonas salinaria TaxID=321339 RepID=A0A1H3GT99_9RHOB|nr:hypothetical protein SAMN05444340_10332 [Citreimonas salinaria]